MTHADPDNEATYKVVSVPGDLHSGRAAADTVVDEVEQARFGVDAVFAIKLALEEAITNAIRHGNGGDRSKQVTIRYAVSPERCAIIVRDQGQGFNPDAVPDCTNAERLSLPYGRGIMLMRTYMDEVTYREAGTEIYMMRRNN